MVHCEDEEKEGNLSHDLLLIGSETVSLPVASRCEIGLRCDLRMKVRQRIPSGAGAEEEMVGERERASERKEVTNSTTQEER